GQRTIVGIGDDSDNLKRLLGLSRGGLTHESLSDRRRVSTEPGGEAVVDDGDSDSLRRVLRTEIATGQKRDAECGEKSSTDPVDVTREGFIPLAFGPHLIAARAAADRHDRNRCCSGDSRYRCDAIDDV